MSRYTIIDTVNGYSLIEDTYNKTYAVFKRCNGFSQQISKHYRYFGVVNKFIEIAFNKEV